MLLNLSNHPSKQWDKKQIETAAETYGDISDIPFPPIDPMAETNEIVVLANDYFHQVSDALKKQADEKFENAVHLQGEFTFVFKLVSMLLQSGINCIASTSERNIEFNDNGEKVVKFKFVRFRDYQG